MSVGALRRVGAWLMALAAVGALAGLVAVMPDAAARAAPAPVFTVAFDGLAPGAPQSRTGTFLLERDATLAAFAWLEREGLMVDAALDVEVCDSAGTCADAASSGTVFIAGEMDVTVTAELPAESVPEATGSVLGQLTFTADEDSALAGTGVDVSVVLAVLAALLAVGALLVAVGHRRPQPKRDGHP